MGLRDDIQIAILEAMEDEDGLFDVVENLDFVIYTDQSGYDVEEDTYHPVPTTSSSRGIFVEEDENYSSKESVTDFQTMVVNPLDLEDGFVPTTEMKIELENGDIYRILEVSKIPGGAATVVMYNLNVAKDAR